MAIDGNLIIILIVLILIGYAVFFYLPIPSTLRTILAIIAAILLFVWALKLMNIIVF